MPLYEHVFLARQDISQAQVEALTKEYTEVIEEAGGKIGKTEYWGVKTIAFKIKKNRKAHYSLMNIDAPPAAIAEMERRMGLSTDVIRFITVRVDEHETEPSIQMRKSDRDDRRDGDRGGGSAVATVAGSAAAAVAASGAAAVAASAVAAAAAAVASARDREGGDRPPRAAARRPMRRQRPQGRASHGRRRNHPRTAAVPSPPQDLPVLRR